LKPSMYDSSIEPPPISQLFMESRAILELGDMLLSGDSLAKAPRGDGHPVLVLPGFMVGDTSTIPLRRFLANLGYRVFPWSLGPNLGYFDHELKRLIETIEAIEEETGQTLSLVGWSLGGIYARELARHKPDLTRQVITLGTPFARSLKASHIRSFYEWVTGNRADEVDPKLFARLQEPPPVPTTAIYTKTDGIVAWETTLEQDESDTVQNISVTGSHCGLGHNAQVLVIIADRLAQPEHEWQCYVEPERPDPTPSPAEWQSKALQLQSRLDWLETWLLEKRGETHGDR